VAPTTAQPPPLARAFDRLSGVGTDRAMIAACREHGLGTCWAGRRSTCRRIHLRWIADRRAADGPANSEGMLISLAAELEAVSGWATKQPKVWWTG